MGKHVKRLIFSSFKYCTNFWPFSVIFITIYQKINEKNAKTTIFFTIFLVICRTYSPKSLPREHNVQNFPENYSKSSAYSVSLTTLRPFVETYRSLENLQKATELFRGELLGAQKMQFFRAWKMSCFSR